MYYSKTLANHLLLLPCLRLPAVSVSVCLPVYLPPCLVSVCLPRCLLVCFCRSPSSYGCLPVCLAVFLSPSRLSAGVSVDMIAVLCCIFLSVSVCFPSFFYMSLCMSSYLCRGALLTKACVAISYIVRNLLWPQVTATSDPAHPEAPLQDPPKKSEKNHIISSSPRSLTSPPTSESHPSTLMGVADVEAGVSFLLRP